MRARSTMQSAGGVSTLTKRLGVALAVVAILFGMLASAAARPAGVLGAPPDPLASYRIDAIGSQIAGTPFGIRVTALDRRNRVVTDHTAGQLVAATLPASPSGATASLGTISWVDGIGTASVTAVTAQATATITVSNGTVSQSASFTVEPGDAANLYFSDPRNDFVGEPVDTESGSRVNSSFEATPEPLKVLATDAYGNRKDGVPVTATTSGPEVVVKSATTGATGEARFENGSAVVLVARGFYTVSATSPDVAPATSRQFEVVSDLAVCNGNSCKNNGTYASQTAPQKTWTESTGTFAGNVVLTTQFSGDPAATLQCTGDDTVFGQATEVRVQDAAASGVSSAQPDFEIAIVFPRATLQFLDITSRGVPSFNVCLGATLLKAGEPLWQAKTASDNPALTGASGPLDGSGQPIVSQTYWGWVPDCAAVDPTSNPCISVRTKDASVLRAEIGAAGVKDLGFKSGDLAVVVSKPWPWDGRMGMK